MAKKRILSLAAVALVLIAGGCGGSDSGATREDTGLPPQERTASPFKEGTGPLSKAEFIRKADRICSKADDTQDNQARAYREAHLKELNELSAVAAEEKLIRLFILPSAVEQIKAIKALGAPKGERKEVKKIMVGLEVAVKKARKNPFAIEDENPSKNPFRVVDDLARAYGFLYCRNVG
ncbi:MAG TPA: hypothetical protein VGO13_07325 [Solirubrobacterales bacterium]|jgi:hypothetical protein|nr:hypothetical protein [Solirubrobacterales bacterium]